MFHRLEHRIRAHVLLSWLALLLIRVAERQPPHEDVRIVVELRDGDPVSELSQTAAVATSGVAVSMVV